MSFINQTRRLFGRKVFGATNYYLRQNFATCEEANLNYFDFAVQMKPHPQKVKKGGEDAYFVNKNVLAVADGVGGWAEVGVDPALYAREVCKHIGELVAKDWNFYKFNPKQLLIDAAYKTRAEGSSTLVIVELEEEKPKLNCSYIGDSGYMIIRKENKELKLVYQSPEQQREFNFPYQIGSYGDSPTIAELNYHQVKHDDIVVVGSDGLFDNLDADQIINVIKPFVEGPSSVIDPTLISEMITSLCYQKSLDPRYDSPFSRRAKAAYKDFRGGKSDDITVVVGQVKIKKTE